MKMKKLTAIVLTIVMLLSIVPAMTIGAASTTTVADLLGGEVVWSAPDVGNLYDADVASNWEGWSSSGDYANLRTYDGYDVLQFYSAYQTDCAGTVTASDTVKTQSSGAETLIIEWKHKGQPESDNYYNFTFNDANGVEITTVTIDKNHTTPSDTHKMGYPANYTDMALVVFNNTDGETHSVEYYVAGEKVYTDSSLPNQVDGFGSIKGSDGWWSNWSHIGFADLTISVVLNTEALVDVTASYTYNGETITEISKRYNTDKGETEATFPELYHSANGTNVLYHASEATLSESAEIELSVIENTSDYAVGDTVAYDGKQYNINGENLIPNSDFSNGVAGWYTGDSNAANETNFTCSDGAITVNGNTGSEAAAGLYRAWDLEVGKTYFFTYTADAYIEWTRITEGSSTLYADTTKNLLDSTTVTSGKNSIVFTATDEYLRASYGWCQGVTLSCFGLYEVVEAEEIVVEELVSVAEVEPFTIFKGDSITLPEELKVTGSLGTVTVGSVSWREPSSYQTGTNTVTGRLSVRFADEADIITKTVTATVNVFEPDHTVETFYHAGNDSNSPNFGLYNHLGYDYNGGVIMSDVTFSAATGNNKLIMYGNSSTSSFAGAGALLRYFNTQVSGAYVFEYYDNGWIQSSVKCRYATKYTLRTVIDITNRTYDLYIKTEDGEFEKLNETPAAFRNGALNSIDRMVYTGTCTMTEHKTAWVSGFSNLTVSYEDENGTELMAGYGTKCGTGATHTVPAPNLIEKDSEIYIRQNVSEAVNVQVTEDMDYTVLYNLVTMTGAEEAEVIHIQGDATLNMPKNVKMTFSDGQTLSYTVTWDTSSVDKDTVGDYEVTGTITDLPSFEAICIVKVKEVTTLPKSTENTVVTNNGGWNWYVEPSGTHIQPGDKLATRYESGQYSSNNGYVFKHDKTYMGWVEDEGTIVVGEYDHDNDTYKRVVIHEFLEADDHNNPAVVVLPDGRIMVFYSKHTTENRMYYCVSKYPEDISEWNDWQYYYCYTEVENSTYNATYPSVFIVHDDEGIEGNDVIYVGWRGVHWKPTLAKFSIPDENGVVETIMGQTQFANTSYYSYDDGGRNDGGRRPYTKYDYDFDRNKMYITFTANHPDNDVNNHIYYVTFDITDQNLYTAKGTLLQPLPFENKAEYVSQGANGTNGQWGIITNLLVSTYPELLVFDANSQISSGGERRGWTWDIKVNEKGEPCIVYVDVTATAPNADGSLPTVYGPSVNDSTRSHHYYWYARWDSETGEWVKTFLTYGGKWWHENATQERCYSGGLTFDHSADDANVIYLSIPTMGEHGNIFEIYRWESEDHGATWTIREPITENSAINNVRPNIIYNYKVDENGNHQGPRLLWKSGEYRYWMNYEYKTGVWTDFAADGFITQDDPEMFADVNLYQNGEVLTSLPVGEATVTGRFNVTNISIGDGEALLALAHYNSEGSLVKVETLDSVIPARSVAQIGMVGAPKMADGSLSPMGTPEIVEEIEYTADFGEGDTIKLFAWNTGIEHPMSDITSVTYEISSEGNKYAFVDTFTYDGTEKLILDENVNTYNGWVSKAYGVDGAAVADNNYAAITKAPFGNTALHLYGISSDGSGIMASHSLPDTQGKDYQIKFSMRYIDEMSWNNTTNAGFTLSHGVPVYNDGEATPCAVQFRHGTSWAHYNGRSSTGYIRPTRWFDGNVLSWIFGNAVYSEQGRGNEYDGLMTGSNYEVTINVSPANKTIDFSIYDGHRTAYHSTEYVDADTYDWDNNPIDTITFSVSGEKWGEIYIDDVTVEIMD